MLVQTLDRKMKLSSSSSGDKTTTSSDGFLLKKPSFEGDFFFYIYIFYFIFDEIKMKDVIFLIIYSERIAMIMILLLN